MMKWRVKEITNKFDIKTTLMGPRASDVQSAQVLGRVVSIGPEGIQYEADPRHAEILVEAMGLENAKTVSTPGVKEEEVQANRWKGRRELHSELSAPDVII